MASWTVPVNELLKEDITKVSHTLFLPGFAGDARGVRLLQETLAREIDTLGELSAAAQGLNKVITTADKMRNSPTHILYILKDPIAKGGQGEAIGLLKVGRKHLFLFDEGDKVCEVEPLCVLDFFVLADRQRHGYGKLLFDHMLRDTGTRPQQLAVDGPSPKMEQFLSRNYGVDRLLRQNNNFAIAPGFFRANAEVSPAPCSAPEPPRAGGRFSAPKPRSAIATVIHGGAHEPFGGAPRMRTPAQSPAEAAWPEREREPEREPEPERRAEPRASPPRPSSLRVAPLACAPPPPAPPPAPSPAGSASSRRDSQLTERGFFDVKFYHNKLW